MLFNLDFFKLRETILARRGQPCAVVGSSGVVVAGSKRSTPIVEPPNSILAEDQVEEREELPRKRPRPAAPVARDEDWATTLFKTLHNNGSDSGRNFKLKLLLQVQALEMGSDILPPHHGPRTSSSINF